MSAPLTGDTAATRPRLFSGATDARALVVEREPAAARDVARVLRTVVGHADIRDNFAAVERHAEWDLAVINYDQLALLERERIFTRFGRLNQDGGLLLLAGHSERDELISLFGRHRARKLLGRNGPINAEDLLITVQKTLRREIFGIDKYLGWGAYAHRLSIKSSSDKELVLSACEELSQTIGLSDRKATLLMTVAEELTTNALYDAPVDSLSRARHASLARSERVDLGPSEEVVVTLASDGRRVGISVEDPFGSLKPETVVDYLAKCLRRGSDQIDRKQGGAGLGLFYAFNSLSHFVVNIEPKKRTEVIGLLDVNGSFRDFEQRAKSFNVFVQE